MIAEQVEMIDHEDYYEYKVPYLNEIKSVLTSVPLSFDKGDLFIVHSNAGNLTATIRNTQTKKCLTIAQIIYGYKVFRLNGDNLDYRTFNCIPFSMAYYNAHHRRYRTRTKQVGIRMNRRGEYYWVIQREGRAYFGKLKSCDKEKVIAERKIAMELPIEEFVKLCSFKEDRGVKRCSAK